MIFSVPTLENPFKLKWEVESAVGVVNVVDSSSNCAANLERLLSLVLKCENKALDVAQFLVEMSIVFSIWFCQKGKRGRGLREKLKNNIIS